MIAIAAARRPRYATAIAFALVGPDMIAVPHCMLRRAARANPGLCGPEEQRMNAQAVSQPAGNVVEVTNVRKVYRRGAEELTVLDGITLEVPVGEFLALMGP